VYPDYETEIIDYTRRLLGLKWVTEWVSRHMIVTCYSISQ